MHLLDRSIGSGTGWHAEARYHGNLLYWTLKVNLLRQRFASVFFIFGFFILYFVFCVLYFAFYYLYFFLYIFHFVFYILYFGFAFGYFDIFAATWLHCPLKVNLIRARLFHVFRYFVFRFCISIFWYFWSRLIILVSKSQPD